MGQLETELQSPSSLRKHRRRPLFHSLGHCEGPDLRTGREATLRQGWVARYEETSEWTQHRGLTVEVPDRTKGTLTTILERLIQGLDTISASRPGSESLFELFRELTINQEITMKGLSLLEAAIKVPYTPENDCYNAIR
jgi:hypothetical protein